METQKLLTLLKRSEGPKLDFKAQLDLTTESGKKELAKDVLAIANSQGGRGHILIGVEDRTKSIIGIAPEAYSEERIQQIVSNRCEPPLAIRYETVPVKDKWVGVITIFFSNKKPHQMYQTGAFYIRRGSTTDFARRDEIAAMLQQGGIIHNEQIPLYNVDSTVLDWDRIEAYLKRTHYPVQNPQDMREYCNLGLLYFDRDEEMYSPTVGAMLLFCPELQRYMPHASIRIVNWITADRQEHWVKGTVIDLLDRSMAIITEAMGDTGYPIEAIEEVLANAIVHRDYFDHSREILVYLGRKRIEISNPGSIHGREPLDNLTRENNPYRRNNWLYHQLMVLDEKSRFNKYGLGLGRIKIILKSRGQVRFINLRKINMFKVVLPGVGHLKHRQSDNEEA